MQFRLKRPFHFVVPVVLLTIICFSARAQRSGMNADGNVLGGSKAGGGSGGYITTDGWSLAVNGGYEAPLGTLKESYKATPTFGLNASKKINHLILSGTVDYRAYKPIQSSFPIEVEIMGQSFIAGEITISNFTATGVYLGAAYEWLITPSASFYGGLNGGYMFSKYSFITETPDEVSTISSSSNIPFLGPKIGLNFAVSNNINIGIEARYSVSVAKAKVDETFELPFTPEFKAYAGNIFLSYNF